MKQITITQRIALGQNPASALWGQTSQSQQNLRSGGIIIDDVNAG